MNAKQVVEQVNRRRYPSSWRVYVAPRSIGLIILFILLAIFTLFITYGFFLGKFWIPGLVMLLTATMFGLFAYLSIKNRHTPFMVIMSDGVVIGKTNSNQVTATLFFPKISSITLMFQSRKYYSLCWLDIYTTDGIYVKWFIPRSFGNAVTTGHSILAAYRASQNGIVSR